MGDRSVNPSDATSSISMLLRVLNNTRKPAPSPSNNSATKPTNSNRKSNHKISNDVFTPSEHETPQSRDDEASEECDTQVFLTPLTSNNSQSNRGQGMNTSSSIVSDIVSGVHEFTISSSAFTKTRYSDGNRRSSPRRALQLSITPTNEHLDSNSKMGVKGNKEVDSSALVDSQPSTATQSSYLTRKAHRFSSMKKTKQTNIDRIQQPTPQLLNRLFSAAQNTTKEETRHVQDSSMKIITSSSSSSDADSEVGVYGRQSSRSIKSVLELAKQELEKNELDLVPGKISSPSRTNRSRKFVSDSPRTSISETFQVVSKNVLMGAESRINDTIQCTIQEVIFQSCLIGTGAIANGTPNSPPTYRELSSNLFDGDTLESSNHLILDQNRDLKGQSFREANEESTEVELKDEQRVPGSSPKSATEPINVQGQENSHFSGFTNLVRALSLNTSEKMAAMSPVETSQVNNSTTSKPQAKKKKPGKLVIPPTFLGNASTNIPDQIYTKSSSSSESGTSTTKSDLHSRESKKNKKLESKIEDSSSTIRTFGMDQQELDSQSLDKDDDVASRFGVSRVELARASRGGSPPPMVRLVSSLEDLGTVQEASSSKETATIESKDSVGDDVHGEMYSFDHCYMQNDEDIATESRNVEQNGSELQNSQVIVGTKTQTEVNDIVTPVQNLELSKKPIVPVDQETPDLQTLKRQYERKVNELKDQTLLADRLAKLRLIEIEKLESELQQQKQKQNTESIQATVLTEEKEKARIKAEKEVQTLKEELDSLREKLSESVKCETLSTLNQATLDKLREEHEQLKLHLAKKDKESEKVSKDNERILRELAEVKEKLVDKEKDKRFKDRGELNRVRKELSEVKEQLEAKEKENRLKTPSKEIQRLQKELSAVKKDLAAKDQELKDMNVEELLRVKEELTRVSTELKDIRKNSGLLSGRSIESIDHNEASNTSMKNSTGYDQEKESESLRSGSPMNRSTPPLSRNGRVLKSSHRKNRGRQSFGNNDSFECERDGQLELVEREKESFRKQIEVMEQQAAKSRQEHEKALRELREASEKEIQLIKRDMETRLAHHLERERALKESLSAVSSREKEDLLEQIELLEAEKKHERNGGLREVQRKEDLLHRISELEKKQKEMSEDHEHTMQHLRATRDAEIQRLRKEMKLREEEQTARERDLQAAISDTSSYEKEDLLDKIEKLQSQLESERSGAVLLKIKISNFEKDLVASELSNKRALERIEREKATEIKQLKAKVEKTKQLEDSLLNALKEKQELEKNSAALQKSNRELFEKEGKEKDRLIKNLRDELAALKAIGSSEKQSIEKFISHAEKEHKEFVEKLKREKDSQIKQLKAELEERKHLEEVIQIMTSENNAMKEELELLTRKNDLEQLRRQKIIDELRKDHSQTLASLKQGSAERLRQAQKEWRDIQLKGQKENEAKYKQLLQEADERVKSISNALLAKEKELETTAALAAQKSSNEKKEMLEELESLKEQIIQLQEKQARDQNEAMRNLQNKENEYNAKVHTIEQNFFDEKRRLQEEIDKQKQTKDEIEARIEEKYKKDFRSQEQKFSFEKKRLLDQINVIKSQQKDDDQSVESRYREKEVEVRKQLLEMEEKFVIEKNELLIQIETEKLLREEQQRSNDEIRQKDFKSLEERFLTEKNSLMQQIKALNLQITKEKSTADHELNEAKSALAKQLKAAEEQFSIEKVTMQEEIGRLEMEKKELEINLKEETQKQIESMEQSFLEEHKSLMDQKNAVIEQMKLMELGPKELETKLVQVQQEHTKELDELLSQLDLVEAEHQGIVDQKNQLLLEKENVISALGTQLSEAQRRISTLDQKYIEQCDLIENLQNKSSLTEETLAACKDELKTLTDAYQTFTEEAQMKQLKACEAAREEMIQRAEVQFKQANEHYIKLRKQFEASQSQVTKLESMLKESRKKLDALHKERGSYEVNLKAEIAQLKASKAKTEADAAQMARDYRREMDRLIETTKAYEMKVHETETTSRNIQTTLATVVSEKEKLQREYDEMKSVSEELMVIVEGLQRREG